MFMKHNIHDLYHPGLADWNVRYYKIRQVIFFGYDMI